MVRRLSAACGTLALSKCERRSGRLEYALSERWMKSVRTEYLDHLFISSKDPLPRSVSSSVTDFNCWRPIAWSTCVKRFDYLSDSSLGGQLQDYREPVRGGLHHVAVGQRADIRLCGCERQCRRSLSWLCAPAHRCLTRVMGFSCRTIRPGSTNTAALMLLMVTSIVLVTCFRSVNDDGRSLAGLLHLSSNPAVPT
jgi:hypothetical protein